MIDVNHSPLIKSVVKIIQYFFLKIPTIKKLFVSLEGI